MPIVRLCHIGAFHIPQVVVFVVASIAVGACSGQTSQPKTDPAQKGVGLSFASTAPTPSPRKTEVTHKSATLIAEAVYYATSPQQSRPPDGVFKTGEILTIHNDQGSYLHVSNAKGVSGWIVSSSVKRTAKDQTTKTDEVN